jgi:hypothetical protein
MQVRTHESVRDAPKSLCDAVKDIGPAGADVVVSGVMEVVPEHGTILSSDQCSGVLAKILEGDPSAEDREFLSGMLRSNGNGSQRIDVVLRGRLRPEKTREQCFELCTPYYFEYAAVIFAKVRTRG